MRTLITLIVFSIFSTTAFSQNPEAQKKIQEKKKEYLKKELNLQEDQEKAFFDLYEEFHTARRNLRIEMQQNRLDLQKSNLSDNQVREIVKNHLALQQKELDLQKEYINKYYKVINPNQVAALLNAEDNFNRLMMDRMRRGGGPGGQNRQGNGSGYDRGNGNIPGSGAGPGGGQGRSGRPQKPGFK